MGGNTNKGLGGSVFLWGGSIGRNGLTRPVLGTLARYSSSLARKNRTLFCAVGARVEGEAEQSRVMGV
jgi:hypothetical protein